jgi:REP element-mobilizing transposase RayT
MARPLRIDVEDGVYHVTSRGLERRRIVSDDADRRKWVDLLDIVATRRDWRVLAWALMDNHYHLFLRTPHADLSAGMHDLNAGYVSWFNRRHRRNGPLLGGRFKAILVERDHHYWELSRYVHLNPLRAGAARRPEEYSWGSCKFYFDSRGAPKWLAWSEVLREHARSIRAARKAYRAFLQEGVDGSLDSPVRDAVAGALMGSPSFVERMRKWLDDRIPDPEVPTAQELRRSSRPEDIEDAVCRAFGVRRERLHARHKHGNEARAAAVYLFRQSTRIPVHELAERFGGVRDSAISKTQRRAERMLRESPSFRAKLRKAAKRLPNGPPANK